MRNTVDASAGISDRAASEGPSLNPFPWNPAPDSMAGLFRRPAGGGVEPGGEIELSSSRTRRSAAERLDRRKERSR
jgi:hypothetical protein